MVSKSKPKPKAKLSWIGFFQSCVDNGTKIILAIITLGGGFFATTINTKQNEIKDNLDSAKVATIAVAQKTDTTAMKVDSAAIKSDFYRRKNEVRDSIAARRDSLTNIKLDYIIKKLK